MRDINTGADKLKLSSFVICLVLVLCTGCKQDELGPDDYMKWVTNKDNGLIETKEIADYTFELMYRPEEYMLLNEIGKNPITDSAFNESKKSFKDMQYYLLRIKTNKGDELMKHNIQSEDEYYGRLEYFMSPMQYDIALVEGKDTLPCVLFHFERNYGMSPYNNFLLAFEKDSNFLATDKEFIYDDEVLNVGPVHMIITKDALKNIPKLKVN